MMQDDDDDITCEINPRKYIMTIFPPPPLGKATPCEVRNLMPRHLARCTTDFAAGQALYLSPIWHYSEYTYVDTCTYIHTYICIHNYLLILLIIFIPLLNA